MQATAATHICTLCLLFPRCQLDSALLDLSSYSHLAFTSKNGILAVLERLAHLKGGKSQVVQNPISDLAQRLAHRLSWADRPERHADHSVLLRAINLVLVVIGNDTFAVDNPA